MPRRRTAEDRLLPRLFHAGVFHALRAVQRIVAALPARWVLGGSDHFGTILYALDHRGRRVARQNLQVIFGDALTPTERKAIQRASLQGAARALGVLLHAAPLTDKRFRRWVDVPPEVERTIGAALQQVKGAIVVSGHFGNWEMLLGLASIFPQAAPVRFLVESTFSPAVDRFLAYLRGTMGGTSEQRSGGARALSSHLRRGGLVGLVVDRNARRSSGGIWAPFCGIDARSTPLPALMARRNDAPIAPIFCLPKEDGRYEIRLLPEPSMDVRSDDPQADILEITTRLNAIVEAMIREQPRAWNWVLKRYKSRPTEELGAYPAYSEVDP
jgi:KDO2-lipid IV(A) lauroyltransferase